MSLQLRQILYEDGLPARIWGVTAIKEANGEQLVTVVRDDGAKRQLRTTNGTLRIHTAALIPMTGVCKICGCTPNHACQGGCWWIAPDVCTSHQTETRLAEYTRLSKLHEEAVALHHALRVLLELARAAGAKIEDRARLSVASECAERRARRRYQRCTRLVIRRGT